MRHFLVALLLALAPASALAQNAQGQKVTLVDERGLPVNTANPTAVVSSPSATATGGLNTYRVSNTASAAAQPVKASPGRIYSYNLCNSAAASRYVRFYNATSATTGTTPVFAGAIIISAGTCQQFTTNFGLTFSTGISVSVTTANGDADTTSPAAGDVSGFIGFM